MSYQGLSNHKVHFEPESVFQKAQYALPKGPPRLGTGRGTPSSYRARDARHLCPLWGQSRHYCRLANHVRSAPNFGHAAALRQPTRWAITGSSRAPGVHGRRSAKVDTGNAPLLRELDRRADAVRVGQRCTALDPAI